MEPEINDWIIAVSGTLAVIAAIYFSFRQIAILNKQAITMEKQADFQERQCNIMKLQSELSRSQTRIQEKQTEIAMEQFQILQQQELERQKFEKKANIITYGTVQCGLHKNIILINFHNIGRSTAKEVLITFIRVFKDKTVESSASLSDIIPNDFIEYKLNFLDCDNLIIKVRWHDESEEIGYYEKPIRIK